MISLMIPDAEYASILENSQRAIAIPPSVPSELVPGKYIQFVPKTDRHKSIQRVIVHVRAAYLRDTDTMPFMLLVSLGVPVTPVAPTPHNPDAWQRPCK